MSVRCPKCGHMIELDKLERKGEILSVMGVCFGDLFFCPECRACIELDLDTDKFMYVDFRDPATLVGQVPYA